MTTEQVDSPGTARQRRKARHWLGVHQTGRPLSGRQLRKWRQWSADPGNGTEYDHLVHLYEMFRSLPEPALPTGDELRTAADDPVGLRRYLQKTEFPNWLRKSLQVARGLWIQSPRPLVFAVAAVLVTYLIVSANMSDARAPGVLTASALVYETRSGEHRKFDLPDGSRVTLEESTTVKFDMTGRERTAILTHGAAVFEVSHNPTLPFRVYAGTGSTTAVGTAFYVEDSSDRVIVKVIEGTVLIDPYQQMHTLGWTAAFRRTDFGRPAPVEVSNGHELAYDVRGTAGTVHTTDSKAVAALLEAPLMYRRRPLQEVVADVQHYSSRHIDVDPAAGRLPFTGTIGRESIDRWVQGLHETLPVEVVDSDHNHLQIRVVSQPARDEP